MLRAAVTSLVATLDHSIRYKMKKLLDFYPELLTEAPAIVKLEPDIDAIMKQLKDIEERNKEEK